MSDPIQPVSTPTPPAREQAPPPAETETEPKKNPPPVDEDIATQVDVTA